MDSLVIQEEINSDNEMLPLFEGKVMGTVKPLDWTFHSSVATQDV